MKITFIIVIIVSLLLTACSPSQPTEQKQVIKCANLIFKCSDNDCGNQCGKLASKNNEKVVTALAVNSGNGCECTYLQYG
jgi:hypothetical protein